MKYTRIIWILYYNIPIVVSYNGERYEENRHVKCSTIINIITTLEVIEY